jgi:hypothetical protein
MEFMMGEFHLEYQVEMHRDYERGFEVSQLSLPLKEDFV